MRIPAPARFAEPPVTTTKDGRIRRVGVEIEFLGPGARTAAQGLREGLGGSVEIEDAHAARLKGSRLGDVQVELDMRHAHPQRHPGLRPVRLNAAGAALLGTLLSPVVPRELIAPPLPFDRLPEIDEAVRLLQATGARGRGAILLDSLGLHFNVEPPRLDAVTIAAYLKAYLRLDERLRRETARGSRRLALVLPPPFPAAYVGRVLARDYWPDLSTLADDYLGANPTRHRPLDLLPLLAHVDEARVRSVLPREKIGARAVFHYRLPLARPSEPDFSIAPDWNRWVIVETLATEFIERQEREAAGAPHLS